MRNDLLRCESCGEEADGFWEYLDTTKCKVIGVCGPCHTRLTGGQALPEVDNLKVKMESDFRAVCETVNRHADAIKALQGIRTRAEIVRVLAQTPVDPRRDFWERAYFRAFTSYSSSCSNTGFLAALDATHALEGWDKQFGTDKD